MKLHLQEKKLQRERDQVEADSRVSVESPSSEERSRKPTKLQLWKGKLFDTLKVARQHFVARELSRKIHQRTSPPTESRSQLVKTDSKCRLDTICVHMMILCARLSCSKTTPFQDVLNKIHRIVVLIRYSANYFSIFYVGRWRTALKKKSSMELTVIWGNSDFAHSDFAPSDFAPSDFTPSDFAPSDFAPSDFAHSDFTHSDFAHSDFTHFVLSKILTFSLNIHNLGTHLAHMQMEQI